MIISCFIIDFFQVGVVAFSLLSDMDPFYDSDPNILKDNNQRVRYDFDHEVWQTVSASAKDFIRKALQLRAENRMNPEESKRHPWISEFFYNHNKASSLNSPRNFSSCSESVDISDDVKKNNSSVYLREPFIISSSSEVHTNSVNHQSICLTNATTGGGTSLHTSVASERVVDYGNRHPSMGRPHHHMEMNARINTNNNCAIA